MIYLIFDVVNLDLMVIKSGVKITLGYDCGMCFYKF